MSLVSSLSYPKTCAPHSLQLLLALVILLYWVDLPLIWGDILTEYLQENSKYSRACAAQPGRRHLPIRLGRTAGPVQHAHRPREQIHAALLGSRRG